MISTWGGEMGGNRKPTNFWSWELHNGLPTKGEGAFFRFQPLNFRGVFKYLKPRPWRKFFISHLGKRESIDSNMPTFGGYANSLEGIYLGFLRWRFFPFPRVYSLSGIFRGVPRTGLGRFAQFTRLQSPGCVEWDHWRHFFVDVKRSEIRDGSIEWHMYNISK